MRIDDKTTNQKPKSSVKSQKKNELGQLDNLLPGIVSHHVSGQTRALVDDERSYSNLPTDSENIVEEHKQSREPAAQEIHAKSVTGDEILTTHELSQDFSLLQNSADQLNFVYEAPAIGSDLTMPNSLLPLNASSFLLEEWSTIGNLGYVGILSHPFSEFQANDFFEEVEDASLTLSAEKSDSGWFQFLKSDQQIPYFNLSATPFLGALALAGLSLGNGLGGVNGPLGLSLSKDSGSSATDGITNNGIINVAGVYAGLNWYYQVDAQTWKSGLGTSFVATTGTHSYRIYQTDGINYTSKVSSDLTVILDTVAPASPSINFSDTGASSLDNITNNPTMTVTGIESNFSWNYRVDGALGSWQTGTGSVFLMQNGRHTYQVQQVDVAGNISTIRNVIVTLDTVTPNTVLSLSYSDSGSSTLDHITNSNQIKVSGLELGANWQYQINNTGAWIVGTVDSFTALTGSNQYRVVQFDDAGNTGVVTNNITLILDTTAPQNPSFGFLDAGINTTDGVTNNPTLMVKGLEPDGLWQYRIDATGAWQNGTGSIILGQSGSHTYEVTVTDLAGNVLSQFDQVGNAITYVFRTTFTVDTTPPVPPVLSLYLDTGNNVTDFITGNPNILVKNLESNSSWFYRLVDGNLVGTWQLGNVSGFDSGLGLKTYEAFQIDGAGNSSALSNRLTLTYDNSLPTVNFDITFLSNTGYSESDAYTSNPTLVITGLQQTNWFYQVDNGDRQAGLNSRITADIGSHVYYAYQVDNNNSTNFTIHKLTVVFDNAMPATPSLSTQDTGTFSTDNITNQPTVTVNGLESDSLWSYRQVDGANTWIVGSGSTFVAPAGLHTFQVQQTDLAGNTSSISSPLAFNLDLSPPAVPTLPSDNNWRYANGNYYTSNPTFTLASLETDGKLQYKLDNSQTWSDATGSYFLVQLGTHSYSLRQIDVAGNPSANSTSATLSIVYDTKTPAGVSLTFTDTGFYSDDNITNNPYIQIVGLAEGSNFEYDIDHLGNWIPVTDNSSFLLAQEGAHSYQVKQIALNGIASAITSLSLSFDSTPPAQPTLALLEDSGLSFGDNRTGNPTVLVSGLEPSPSRWKFVTYNSENAILATSDGVNDNLVVTQFLNRVAAYQIDVAGNTGEISTVLTVTYDNALPLFNLQGKLLSDSGNSSSDWVTNNPTILIYGVSNSTWTYGIDVAVPNQQGAGSSFLASSGVHTYSLASLSTLTGVGQSGKSVLTINYDNIPPAQLSMLTVDSGNNASDGYSNYSTISIFNLENLASWQYRVDGTGSWFTRQAAATTTFQATRGSHSYEVRQIDLAGNLGPASAAKTFILDDVAPQSPQITITDTGRIVDDNITSNPTITLSGLENTGTWEYAVNSTVTWTLGSQSTLLALSGSNQYYFRQTDFVGNISSVSTQVVVYEKFLVPTPTLSFYDVGLNTTDNITNQPQIRVANFANNLDYWSYRVDGTSGTWQTGTGSIFLAREGSHSYEVMQVDKAGNMSAIGATLGFTLDTTVPNPPAILILSDTGANTTDGISGNATLLVSNVEPGANWYYGTSNAGTIGSWVKGSGSYFLANAGARNYAVYQQDLAGNNSRSGDLFFYNYNSTLPDANLGLALATDSGQSSIDHITNVDVIKVLGLVPNVSWSYKVNAGGWLTGTGTTIQARNGANTYLVQQVDGNDTHLLANNFTVELDTVAPSAATLSFTDSGASSTDNITRNQVVSVSNLVANSTWQYQLDGTNNWSTGTNSFFLASEGSHSYVVRVIDVAGNTSSLSNSLAFTLDTTFPNTLSVSYSDTGTSSTDGVTYLTSLQVGQIEAANVWYYREDGGVGGIWTQGTSTNITANIGAHLLEFYQADVAGNSSSVLKLNLNVDQTPPATPSAYLLLDTGVNVSDHITGNPTVLITQLESNAKWNYRTFDGGVAGAWISGSGSSFLINNSNQAHVYQVVQLDLAGNSSTVSSNITLQYDSLLPVSNLNLLLLQDTGVSSSDGVTNSPSLKLQGLDAGVVSWGYKVDSGVAIPLNLETTQILAQSGSHTYLAYQVDRFNNQTWMPTALTVVYDNSAPSTVSASTSDLGSSLSDGISNHPTIRVNRLESNASWSYLVDGGGSWIQGTNSSFSALEGAHFYEILQTDVAGNIGLTSTPLLYTYDKVSPSKPSLSLQVDSGISQSDQITGNPTVVINSLETQSNWFYRTVDAGVTGNLILGVGSTFLATSGSHTYEALQVDLAGNTSTLSDRLAVQYNTSLPTKVFSLASLSDSGISSTDKISNDPTIVVNELNPSATWFYKIDNGANQTGTGSTLMATLGSHTYTVFQVNGAVTTTSSQTLTLQYDTGAPVAPVFIYQDTGSNSTDHISNDPRIGISGLESGAFWQYKAGSGSWQGGSGSQFLALSGTMTYQIKQTDLAGNVSPVSTLSLVLDTVAPTTNPNFSLTDTGIFATDNITNNPTVVVTGLEANSSWAYRVDGFGGSWIAGTGTTFLARHGVHTYKIQQIDSAGNQALSNNQRQIELDTQSPSAVSLRLLADTGTNTTDGTTGNPTIAILGLENNAIWYFRSSNNLGTSSWSRGTDNYLMAVLGSNTYEVAQVDLAGNTSATSQALSVNYDNAQALFAFQLLPVNNTGVDRFDSYTSNPTVQVVGLSSPNNNWKYKVDSTDWQTGTGSTFIASTGSHNYQVYQVDSSSSTTTSSSTLVLNLDTDAPNRLNILLSDTGSSSTDGVTSLSTITITGLENMATWQYRLDGSSQPWMVGTGSILSATPGSHVYEVRQRDLSGNWSDVTSKNVDYDTISPNAPAWNFAQSALGTSRNQVLLHVEPKALVQVKVDSGAWSDFATASSNVVFGAFNNQFSVEVGLGNDGLLRVNNQLISLSSSPGSSLSTYYRLGQLQALFNVGGQVFAHVNNQDLPVYSEDSIYDILRVATVDVAYTAQTGSHTYQFRQVDLAGNVSPITTQTIEYTSATLPYVGPEANLTTSSEQWLYQYPMLL